jgi:ATP-binding cassette subfamily F protein 3
MIDFNQVGIHFTGENLFSDATFKINNSDKIALVGSNGSGKSTILKLISNSIEPTDGTINKKKNIKVGYLPQEFINTSSVSLFEEVRSSLKYIIDIEKQDSFLHSKLNSISNDQEKEKILSSLDEVENLKHLHSYYTIDSEIKKVLVGLGFSENDFKRKVTEFSGGWQMRIELSKILLGKNDLLMMDEPTNHLDIESLQWLISFLQSYNGALLLVSHDKFFLNKLTNRTLELYNKAVTFFNGNYDKYLLFKKERDIQLKAAFANQERKRKQTERFIERFRYKNTKAKQVQSRIKQLDKLEKIEIPDYESKIEIKFPPVPSGGSVPLELDNVSKSYDTLNVFSGINLQMNRGEKFAFLGPNGAGKTTLARMIAGEIKDYSGTIKFGHNTTISYYAQEVADSLNGEDDLLDVISSTAPDLTPGRIRNILGSFLFSDDDVFKKIKVLSGGEKSRVALAKILVTQANLIVLDEPTNHLDITSKEMLQKALIEFDGSLIIVSHDIDFLRPITDKIVEIKDGRAKLFHGDIDYYLFKSIQENAPQNNGKTISQSTSVNNRKEAKRKEAEKRQERFKATKELKQKIDKLENLIAELEEKKTTLESELAMESVYSNPTIAKEKNSEYEVVKNNLDETYRQWSELTEKLETIEKSFDY